MNNLRQIARAGRAETLAWKTLESLPLGAADDDEKTRRKLHLIKGPRNSKGSASTSRPLLPWRTSVPTPIVGR